MTLHTIPNGVQPMGLARYLSRAWPMMPNWALRDALKKKDIRVNGARSGGDAMVRGGDELTLYLPERFVCPPPDILYQDDFLLVARKPSGLPVDADADGIGADTLLTRLHAVHPEAALCHRLDAFTGGLVLASLCDEAQDALLAAFRENRVHKRYRCVVYGTPRLGLYEDRLQKDAKASRTEVVREGGALSRLRVLTATPCRTSELSLLEIELLTGRTHQIRAQMAAAGHPLLGDDKYGDRDLNRRLRAEHPLLWCVQLTLEGDGSLSRYAGVVFSDEARFGREDLLAGHEA